MRTLGAGTFFILARNVLAVAALSPTTGIAPPRCPPSNSVRVQAFRRWCDDVGISAPNLEHGRNADGVPGVTVRPTAALQAGECAIVIPAHAALITFDDMPENGALGEGDSPVPHLVNDETWKETLQHHRLAILLIDERRKGSSSRLRGYVEHLPPLAGPGRERIDTLARWTDAELSLLRAPFLVDASEHRERMNGEWFDSLPEEGSRTGNQHERGAAVTREEFDWALDVVTTRAFSGNFSGRKGAKDGALLPFIDDLNHGEVTSREGNEGGDSTLMSGKHMKFNPEHDQFTWVAKDAYSGGDEVTHGYLRGAVNEEFLLAWGFTPDRNEDDVGRIQVEGVFCQVGQDGRIDEEDRVVGELLDGGIATEEEAWRSIADACDAEALTMESDAGLVEGPVSEQRRSIAEAFVDSRQRLLRTGRECSLERASESMMVASE